MDMATTCLCLSGLLWQRGWSVFLSSVLLSDRFEFFDVLVRFVQKWEQIENNQVSFKFHAAALHRIPGGRLQS